jgi:hypothetical protein
MSLLQFPEPKPESEMNSLLSVTEVLGKLDPDWHRDKRLNLDVEEEEDDGDIEYIFLWKGVAIYSKERAEEILKGDYGYDCELSELLVNPFHNQWVRETFDYWLKRRRSLWYRIWIFLKKL